MFTGIVREMGTVERLARDERGARLAIRAAVARELAEGDSVAIAGACLTVADRSDSVFEVDAMNQTLELTTLGELREGDPVNLEPALRAGEPLGGHLVQGHVDGTATVRSVDRDGIARRVWIDPPAQLGRYVASQGSIAVDGVSLTVSAVDGSAFEVALIPETLARSTLGALEAGDRVNLEVDLVARYLERLTSNVG